MKRRITQVGPLKFGITFAIFYGVTTLTMCLPMAIITTFFTATSPSQLKYLGLTFLFMPLPITAMGFILGVVMAAMYNLASRFTGGIEVSVEDGA